MRVEMTPCRCHLNHLISSTPALGMGLALGRRRRSASVRGPAACGSGGDGSRQRHARTACAPNFVGTVLCSALCLTMIHVWLCTS